MPILSRILRALNKPEYFFNPPQLLRRLKQVGDTPAQGPRTFRLPWGVDIDAMVGDDIGNALLTLGVYDLVVMETLHRLIQPGDIVADIGANIGCMSSLMAVRVGKRGAVFSFEAHPGICSRLEKNRVLWKRSGRIGDVHIVNQAISDRAGEVFLRIPPGFGGNQGLAFVDRSPAKGDEGVTVPATTLDAVFKGQPAPSLMKFDVENHELEALKGASRLLRSGSVRNIVFEDHGEYPSQPARFLLDQGYSVYRIQKTFVGPRLVTPSPGRQAYEWEPPSLLATLDPAAVSGVFGKRGWRVLRTR